VRRRHAHLTGWGAARRAAWEWTGGLEGASSRLRCLWPETDAIVYHISPESALKRPVTPLTSSSGPLERAHRPTSESFAPSPEPFADPPPLVPHLHPDFSSPSKTTDRYVRKGSQGPVREASSAQPTRSSWHCRPASLSPARSTAARAQYGHFGRKRPQKLEVRGPRRRSGDREATRARKRARSRGHRPCPWLSWRTPEPGHREFSLFLSVRRARLCATAGTGRTGGSAFVFRMTSRASSRRSVTPSGRIGQRFLSHVALGARRGASGREEPNRWTPPSSCRANAHGPLPAETVPRTSLLTVFSPSFP